MAKISDAFDGTTLNQPDLQFAVISYTNSNSKQKVYQALVTINVPCVDGFKYKVYPIANSFGSQRCDQEIQNCEVKGNVNHFTFNIDEMTDYFVKVKLLSKAPTKIEDLMPPVPKVFMESPISSNSCQSSTFNYAPADFTSCVSRISPELTNQQPKLGDIRTLKADSDKFRVPGQFTPTTLFRIFYTQKELENAKKVERDVTQDWVVEKNDLTPLNTSKRKDKLKEVQLMYDAETKRRREETFRSLQRNEETARNHPQSYVIDWNKTFKSLQRNEETTRNVPQSDWNETFKNLQKNQETLNNENGNEETIDKLLQELEKDLPPKKSDNSLSSAFDQLGKVVKAAVDTGLLTQFSQIIKKEVVDCQENPKSTVLSQLEKVFKAANDAGLLSQIDQIAKSISKETAPREESLFSPIVFSDEPKVVFKP